MEKIILIGAGGHAKSVIDSLKAQGKYEPAGIIDKTEVDDTHVLSIPLIGTDEDLPRFYEKGYAMPLSPSAASAIPVYAKGFTKN